MILEPPRLGEAVGVHEHQHPEFLDPPEHRAEAVFGQILAGDMGHDLDAAHAERFVQPLQFGDRQFRRLQRNGAEAGEAIRMPADNIGDIVVDRAREIASPRSGSAP